MHDFGATLQFGVVAAVDDAAHCVRVSLPALEGMQTDWLPVVSLGAGGNRFYALPDIGEQAVCLLDARGEGGVCLGVVYNAVDTAPASSRDIWMKRFRNGTVISHDRRNGQVTVETEGEVRIKAAKVRIDAPETETTGNLTVEGSLTYMQGMTGYGTGGDTAVIQGNVRIENGDLTADGIGFKKHTHAGDSGGTTGAAQ